MSIDYTACSDGELAALTLAGRQSAFAEIMGRHRKPIYRLVRGLVGDSEEALDLTQLHCVPPQVLLTGGDAPAVQALLRHTTHLMPDLVLEGVARMAATEGGA